MYVYGDTCAYGWLSDMAAPVHVLTVLVTTAHVPCDMHMKNSQYSESTNTLKLHCSVK